MSRFHLPALLSLCLLLAAAPSFSQADVDRAPGVRK